MRKSAHQILRDATPFTIQPFCFDYLSSAFFLQKVNSLVLGVAGILCLILSLRYPIFLAQGIGIMTSWSLSDVEGYRATGDVYGAPDGYRVPREGSPRHSGDEVILFLPSKSWRSITYCGSGISHSIQRVLPPTANSNSPTF